MRSNFVENSNDPRLDLSNCNYETLLCIMSLHYVIEFFPEINYISISSVLICIQMTMFSS